MPPPTVFLLSPATMDGVRAKQILSPRAKFDTAVALRSEAGVEIQEAFSFMSALYFRGKIAYAKRFANVDEGIRIIAPGFGLVPPDWRLDRERVKKIQRIGVDAKRTGYRRPLERDARELAATLPDDGRVVLLGSIATGKYVDVLWPVLGTRLLFPATFVGIGDMSRGSLMLKAARSGEELEYSTLDVPRHRPRKQAINL